MPIPLAALGKIIAVFSIERVVNLVHRALSPVNEVEGVVSLT